eukprot:scaffold5615_cov103-Isochrysis_galbana.AAC.2
MPERWVLGRASHRAAIGGRELARSPKRPGEGKGSVVRICVRLGSSSDAALRLSDAGAER